MLESNFLLLLFQQKRSLEKVTIKKFNKFTSQDAPLKVQSSSWAGKITLHFCRAVPLKSCTVSRLECQLAKC